MSGDYLCNICDECWKAEYTQMFVVTAWPHHCVFLYIVRTKLGSSSCGDRIQDLWMKLIMFVPTTSQQVAHTTDRSSQTQSLKKYNFHTISISQHLQKNSTKNIHQRKNYKDTSQNEHTNQTPKWRHKKQ